MLRLPVLLLATAAAGGLIFGSSAAVPQQGVRILYGSEWAGPAEIYAVDPARRSGLAQVTFERVPPTCLGTATACGVGAPVPSPDGRRIVYRTAGQVPEAGRLSASYWVARIDGRDPKLLPGPAVDGFAPDTRRPAWSHDSKRLAYAATDGLHVMLVDGSGDRIVWPGGAWHATWSRGGALAFISGETLVVLRGGRTRTLVPDGVGRPWPGDFGAVYDPKNRMAWSPDGRMLAFRSRGAVAVVDGRSGRVTTYGRGYPVGWSGSRRLAYHAPTGVGVLDLDSGRRVRRRVVGVTEAALSADGAWLAYATGAGLEALETRTGRARRLTPDHGSLLAWSPVRPLLAYLLPREVNGATGQDIRTVTLSGSVRIVVSAAGAFGGQLSGLAWTRPAAGANFRAPEPVEGVYVGGRVTRLATDGAAIAMVTCGLVGVWRPPAAPVRVDDRADGGCSDHDRADIPHALALAGDRVAYQVTNVGLGYRWELVLATTVEPVRRVRLASGFGSLGRPTDDAAGSGRLLVYSSYPTIVGSEHELFRVEPDATSTRIKTEPLRVVGEDALHPLDADAGRVLTRGSHDYLRVVDDAGRTLLAISVVPDAAALDGNDIVALAAGELRHFDATTGALLHAWPAGPLRVAWPVGVGAVDVARGLASYATASGEIRVRRLADGREGVVGFGALSRFVDDGLAIADGARVRIVPDARLAQLVAGAG